MDRELGDRRGLTGSRSAGENNGRDNTTKSRPVSYAERFEEAAPYYIALGMSYEQFWNGDVYAARDYRKALRLKRQMDNETAWLHGLYVYEALCDVAPVLRAFSKVKRPQEYPTEPHDLYALPKQKEDKQEKQYLHMQDRMESFMDSFNKKFKEKAEVNADGRDRGDPV